MSWAAEILAYVLSTIGALLPIVNPFSAAPMVVSITADLTDEERNHQVRRACIYMFVILTAFGADLRGDACKVERGHARVRRTGGEGEWAN